MPTCDEVRELLWPLDRPRRSVEGEAAARAHVASCAACRGFFARDAALAQVLRATRLPVTAPEAVRRRVLSSLVAEPAGPARPGGRAIRRRRAFPWAVAAAAVLVAAIGLWGGRPASLDAAYAQDYMSRAVEQTAVETPDPGRVYELFMRELGVPVTPVSLDNSRLSRAMICLIRGKRAAMVEYEVEGHVIAHYRVPLARPGRASAPMRITTEDGVCVIRWSDGEFEHALVADVAVHQLRTIAETQFAAR